MNQYERITETEAKEVFVNRGYRGIKEHKGIRIYVTGVHKKISKTQRKKHSRRAAIEPVIGHLKKTTGYAEIILKVF